MKRRSFFQRVIGGFAAAIGLSKVTPVSALRIDLTPYKGEGLLVWDVPGAQWIVMPSVPGGRIYISAETKAQLDAHFWP